MAMRPRYVTSPVEHIGSLSMIKTNKQKSLSVFDTRFEQNRLYDGPNMAARAGSLLEIPALLRDSTFLDRLFKKRLFQLPNGSSGVILFIINNISLCTK